MGAAANLPEPLPVEALYHGCRLEDLAFETTDTLPDLEHPFGQDRAVEALRFGSSVQGNDFNLYVMGPSGIGKHTVTRRFLEQRAQQEPVPEDRCYVYNFAQPGAPRLITLRPGEGRRFAKALDQLCEELESAIPAIFESEEYQSRLQELQRTFGRRQERAIGEIQAEAEAHDIALIVTPGGFTFAPEKDGEAIDQEAFEALPEEERSEIERVVKSLQQKLQRVVQQFPKWRKETQQQLQALNEEMAQIAIGQSITDLRKRFRDNPAVVDHLDAIRSDVVNHVDALRRSDDHHEMAEPIVQRYRANVLVANDELEGAPVIYEDLPTYHHLLGRIEHRVVQGALITDFSLIQSGALHRANGGYLMIDALKLLMQPFAWEALKRSLKSHEIRIESLEQMYSVLSTVSLRPEPAPSHQGDPARRPPAVLPAGRLGPGLRLAVQGRG
ncbi:MAG: ATP-binding protein [Halofilum sp. (in: g-proteobacteria)]|nr:ATP-binding protein [Halofilum sp. (in: g-proteobacteria)]